jgi:hypothetical protein
MSDRPHLEVRDPPAGSEVAVLYDPASPFGEDAPVAWLEYDEGRGRLRWYVRPRAATAEGDESMRAPSLEYVTTLAAGDEELVEQIAEVTRRYKRLATKYAAKLEKSRDRSDRMTSQQLRNDLRSDGLKLSHG